MTAAQARSRRLVGAAGVGALCAALAGGFLAAPARAAGPLVVTWPSDDSAYPSACTLRDAVAAAGTDTAVGGCAAGSAGRDTITFSPQMFQVGSPSTIRLSTDLVIGDDLTIDTTGAGVVIDGAGAWKFVVQGPASATFERLVVADTPCAIKGTGGSDGSVRSTILVLDSRLTGGICGGVGDGGDVTVQRSTIAGGGVGGDGHVTVTDSSVTGGSIFGGYYGNLVTVTRSSITGPSTTPGVNGWKGDLIVTDSTVSGFGIGVSEFEGSATITGSSVTGNGTGVSDGLSITITGSSISHNTGTGVTTGRGGIVITGSTIAGNGGPGIDASDLGVPVSVRDSTISGNAVGLSLAGTERPTELVNSTIADNHGARGAAILVHDTYGPLSLSLDDVTIAGNSSTTGGALANDGDFPVAVQVRNTLLVGSSAAGCSGTWTFAGGSNLADDSTCGAAFDLVTADRLRLSPLRDNGGPTQTVALLPGSSAIGAGDASLLPAGLVHDQRGTGFDRMSGGSLDVGAYELQVIGATVSLDALPGSVVAGSRVLIRGSVRPSGPGGDAARPVEVWFRPARTGTWVRRAVLTASAASGWTFRSLAVARETGLWRVVAPAVPTYREAVSSARSVRAIARVVGWPGGATTNLAYGRPLVRTVAVVPGFGRAVVLQARSCARCAWRTVATRRVDARSRVAFVVSAPRRGSVWFRLVVPRTTASLGVVTGPWRVY